MKFNKMKAQRIYDIFSADWEKLQYKARRICDKLKNDGDCITERWHNKAGLEYSITVLQDGGSAYTLCSPIGGIEGRETFYVVSDYTSMKNSRGLAHFTRHWMERYNERCMGGKLFVFNGILQHTFKHNATNLIIWNNEERTRFVIAHKKGLSFCNRNLDTNICSFCTFVSLNMLHEDQQEAYHIVKEIIALDDKLHRSGISYQSAEYALCGDMLERKAQSLKPLLGDILKKYENEMN